MKFKVLVLIIFFFNCNHRNEKIKDKRISIKGNWYSFKLNSNLLELDNTDEFLYKEFLYSDDNLFSYSDILGFSSPMKYEIIKDSLFWFFNKKKHGLRENTDDFIGLIRIVNDSLFIVKNKSDSLLFYKIKKKGLMKTLSHTIIDNDSLYLKTNNNEKKYMDDFRKRKQDCFDENR